MKHVFDKVKDDTNLRKHGLCFDQMEYFDWNSAQITQDDRNEYRETRLVAIGDIDGTLCVAVFTQEMETLDDFYSDEFGVCNEYGAYQDEADAYAGALDGSDGGGTMQTLQEDCIRMISLRQAERHEINRYKDVAVGKLRGRGCLSMFHP